jgi:NAD(P)-dependent dehydrogenase (short-subunit alcohol dehydrogenase family)
MPGLLSGRAVLVTGAQQGIGRAIAIAAAAAGASVGVNYLDDERAAQDVADRVREFGQEALVHRADVSNVAEVGAMVDAFQDRFGGIDVLVNNAGIFPRSPVLSLAEEEWDQVVDVNLKGSFFCAQAAARGMIRHGRRGAIVNLSSITMRGTLRGAHYVATKGGISSLTRALALELAPHGIRVNAIAPGIIDTAQPRFGMSEEEIRLAGEAIPLGRIGRSEEIASLAVFLAGEGASFITGQTVHANGGALMV